jgi:hypothetical protein
MDQKIVNIVNNMANNKTYRKLIDEIISTSLYIARREFGEGNRAEVFYYSNFAKLARSIKEEDFEQAYLAASNLVASGHFKI